jgi:hypothetical protein
MGSGDCTATRDARPYPAAAGEIVVRSDREVHVGLAGHRATNLLADPVIVPTCQPFLRKNGGTPCRW